MTMSESGTGIGHMHGMQSERLLHDGWTVARIGARTKVPFSIPGDIHSALLAEEEIPDPYWRDTETSLDWVHESQWQAETLFTLEEPPVGTYCLSLDNVDCHAILLLNGIEIGRCESQFLRYDFDVSKALQQGDNRLAIRFLSNSREARDSQERFPFKVPHIFWNCRLPHYNFLRKPQCHAGWDWNIALSPLGVYGAVRLRKLNIVRLDDIMVRQRHVDGAVHLDISVFYQAHEPAELTLAASIDGQVVSQAITVWPGEGQGDLSITINQPRLWWPKGHGEQPLYDLTVMLDGQSLERRIGLRQIELITDKDEIGSRFAFRVNGREIFCRGANWIPADALPARATPDRVRDLLTSAIDANMNMIRIWGGGQYEPDWFYDLCSELGLLVWHDFMFACNLYPAADPHWLDLVRQEARQQISRLSSQPCMALWCGDNELVGALTWYEESKADRDRYLAMYDRLNHALEEAIRALQPDIAFWPSSPSVGPLNFGDGWHDDTSGDMHFWDVWHSAKDFEHYRTVQPRFCSEFGFQSFPSKRVIDSFTEPGDRNVSSPIMDVHQRNEGGNSRIVETIARYFRFPDSFDDLTYLSQISQALAMKTAIEWWRSAKPRCMGTLFWQLNDTWPVASWSSLDYGGGWKLLHYMARRFYAPILVTAQPDPASGDILLLAINDMSAPLDLTLSISKVELQGAIKSFGDVHVTCPMGRAMEVTRIKPDALGEDAFLHFEWVSKDGLHRGENDYLPKRPKEYDLPTPSIDVDEHVTETGETEITLLSDKPAFFVTYHHGGDRIYSDNCVTLLPGRPKKLTVIRQRRSHLPAIEAEVNYLKQ